MDTLKELFVHELKDIYDAEKRLVDVLGEAAASVEDDELVEGFESHQQETREHVKRLEKVFQLVGERAEAHPCAGIAGLITEREEFMEEESEPEIVDLFHATAAMKVERYEMTAYESLIRMADELSLEDVSEILSETLKEEKAALEKVAAFAAESEPSAQVLKSVER